MRLYNTLTRQVEELKPLNPPEVTIYTCGPTVYDYSHIGHWFNYVRMDTLVRTVKASGFKPKWVMNITDVGHLVSDADEGEDKLEKGAKREGKTAWEVAEYYTKDFVEGMKQLNTLEPEFMPRATQHISEQIDLIKTLEDKGYTYEIDDGVYYDTSKFTRYADFARLDLDEQQAGARVEFNQQKRNRSDFALWKFSPANHQRDMEWDSPWGKGFPGWHIECSAMSMKYLGDTIDIHTGGIDHVSIHHTNEIAQSEAATGKVFASCWMHSNHVTANGEKISKSLGNGVRLQDLIERGVSLMAVRLHILESHYRSQSKFSWDSLKAAANRLNDWRAFAALRWQLPDDESGFEFYDFADKIVDRLVDDLNTPEALVEAEKAITSFTSGFMDYDSAGGQPSSVLTSRADFDKFITLLDNLFGLNLLQIHDITAEQKQLISDREQARLTQDWSKSDELRAVLETQGLGVRDTPRGAIWFPL